MIFGRGYTMKRVANYHSHVALCGHAEGVVEDYVQEALKHKYEEIGISDHCPVPRSWMKEELYRFLWLDQQMNEDDFYEKYLPQLEYSINKHRDIKILKAVETEYVEGQEAFYKRILMHLDYLVLGVHFYKSDGEFVSTYEPLSDKDLYNYALIVEKALDTKLYKILAHPELFLYHKDEFLPLHEEITKKIIFAAMKNDVYLEINANGFNFNSPKPKYPRKEFWEIVRKYKNVKIILNSDAHYVKDFHGENVKKAIDFAKELNLNVSSKIEL